MEKKSKKSSRQRFSKALEQAISAESLYVEVDLPQLGKKDVEDLKAILSGKKSPDFPVADKRAINALTRSDRSEDTVSILSSVLADRKRPAKIRALAALRLDHFSSGKAEDALIRQLRDDNPSVRTAVIKSLGKIGSQSALKALNSVHPDDERTARQLSFARTTIGMRTRPKEVDIEENLGIQWDDFAASPVKATEVRKQISNIWGGTYGIELNPEYGLEFHCGASRHLVFLNRSLQKGAFAKSLKSENMIAGLVALAEEASHLVIRYILFSIPDKNSVRLAVARTDGSILFTGEAATDGKGLQFTIRDVDKVVTPTVIRVSLEDGEIKADFRVLQKRVAGRKAGREIPV